VVHRAMTLGWQQSRGNVAPRWAEVDAAVRTELLSGMRLLAGLNNEQLSSVASLWHQRRLGEGQCLFSEVDVPSRVIVVVHGQVTVESTLFQECHLRPCAAAVEKVGPGGVIGCCALIGGGKGMTARCTENTEIIVADAHELRSLLAARPDIGFVVMENAFRIATDRLLCARQCLLAQFGLCEMYQTYRNY